jgi:hypothetical protein
VSSERLHPDDLVTLAQLVAADVADRVLTALDAGRLFGEAPAPGRMITATQAAEMLGLSRDAVYRRKHELGAVRFGDGPRARLRFDAEKVTAALATCSTGRRSQKPNPAPRHRSRPQRTPTTAAGSPLLPVRGVPGL